MTVDAGVLLEAAHVAKTVEEYERAALDYLDRTIGADVAMFVRNGAPGSYAPGFDAKVRHACADRWQQYALDLRDFAHTVIRGHGVGVDVEYFGKRGLERLCYFDELMRPHRGRSTLMAFLMRGGVPVSKLVLGRCSPGFSAKERDYIVKLIPALSVCEAAVCSPPPPTRELNDDVLALSPREREVISYLQLGYTNAEIALACGNAPRTVRNQLSSIFKKLGASTRAEAVALSLQAKPPT
jgi:DNA-binding CsgD family transcriptional regulator